MEDPIIPAAAIIQARLPAAVEALYPIKTTPSRDDDGVDAAMSEADTGAAADITFPMITLDHTGLVRSAQRGFQ